MPDVASDAAAAARPLDWVGMSNIALPLRVASASGEPIQVAASVDISVDLADAEARGIHMSRLYLQLQHAFASEVVTPAGLRRVLQTLVETQAGLSSRARLVLRYEQLLLRPALASGHSGWKSYPVEIEAALIEGHLRLAHARKLRPPLRRHGHKEAQRGGSRDTRQDQHGRVRHGLFHGELGLRPHS